MRLRTALMNVDEQFWKNETVQIKPLKTQDELIYAIFDCQLTEEQKEYVNPAGFSIGRAYLCSEDNYPCIIYDNQMKPIGFITLCKWLGEEDAYSWSYYIDRRYQGNGYGKSAAQVAINVLKAADCNKSIKLATEEDNHRAQRLYAELGFVKLQELDGDDIVFGL